MTKQRKRSADWERRWRLAGWAFCSGCSNAQVAHALGISVEHLRMNMKRKGKTRPMLMREYLRSNYLDPFWEPRP